MNEDIILWLDIETTGLSILEDDIWEIAAIITDREYNEIRRGHWYVKYDSTWSGIDYYMTAFEEQKRFVYDMHITSGLRDDWLFAQADGSAFDLPTIDTLLCDFVSEYEGLIVLAGSSVHYDHQFIIRDLHAFSQRLMHRHHDISSVKTMINLIKRGASDKYREDAGNKHRAMDDIENDIRWAKNFRHALVASGVLGETPPTDAESS